jgi:mono/diheme cytochrome c family protein
MDPQGFMRIRSSFGETVVACLPSRLHPIVLLLAVVLMLLADRELLANGASGREDSVSEDSVEEDAFEAAARILENKCLSCHAGTKPKGGLSLESLESLLRGGESGPAILPDKPDESLLIDYVVGNPPEMPKSGNPLSADEVSALKNWIAQGAKWPKDRKLEDRHIPDAQWWSLKPLVRPDIPEVDPKAFHIANPIDAFVVAKLQQNGLPQSICSDRRTLIRRLSFDLIGLPPTPEQISAFVNDSRSDEQAYSDLVDQLLESPRYGERWARHWLDVVHFGETHGYDKDKLRPNAWPYRDYVIRAFNEDKPYSRFIEEQLAGDILYPDTADGIEALGFISAGPWDFIGHAEVPESKIDGKVARHLDRDDMVATAIGTFNSLTVGCAQCHNHKFDPIPQKDYYRLQAVFAAVDRADQFYDRDPQVAAKRRELDQQLAVITKELEQIEQLVKERGGKPLADLDRRIAEANKAASGNELPEFGYHSQIENRDDAAKWVQVDLGESKPIDAVELVGCHDTFNNIGAGFGFPVRFLIQACDDPAFETGVLTIVDRTAEDFPNPGVMPQRFEFKSNTTGSRKFARYVRVTATKLVHRLPTDFIFALAELSVYSPEGRNIATGAVVTSLDSIEAAPRWQRRNLVDAYYYGKAKLSDQDLKSLQEERGNLIETLLDAERKSKQADLLKRMEQAKRRRSDLPPQQVAYVGMVHNGSGAFVGTGASGGKPRSIHVLDRGNVTQPKEEVTPGALSCLEELSPWFELPQGHTESQRRAALARWISDKRNPLTWRSIVNRVWQYHFGRGIVQTPNDLGRMGAEPTHPELLDWLAVEFRDHGESLKRLNRWIVTSHTYRQVSSIESIGGATSPESIDVDNRFLWRANRRRLEAEAIRDVVLQVSGKLDLAMGGPSFQDFVIEHPEHSPHYQYHLYDPEDPRSHRRSVYRFLVRSQPQPFMTTLDCADPSMRVDKRNESLSPLQALALLNNGFMISMSGHLAKRLEKEGTDIPSRTERMYQLAFGRSPNSAEQLAFEQYIAQYGLENACRLIFNLNEFSFID